MAKVIEMVYGLTVSKNYQSVKVELKLSLEDGDDPTATMNTLRERVHFLAEEEKKRL